MAVVRVGEWAGMASPELGKRRMLSLRGVFMSLCCPSTDAVCPVF